MLRVPAALLLWAAAMAADDLDSEMKSITQTYAVVEQNAAEPISSE